MGSQAHNPMSYTSAATAAITAAGAPPSQQLIDAVTFTTEGIRRGTGCTLEAAAAEAFATWADLYLILARSSTLKP